MLIEFSKGVLIESNAIVCASDYVGSDGGNYVYVILVGGAGQTISGYTVAEFCKVLRAVGVPAKDHNSFTAEVAHVL